MEVLDSRPSRHEPIAFPLQLRGGAYASQGDLASPSVVAGINDDLVEDFPGQRIPAAKGSEQEACQQTAKDQSRFNTAYENKIFCNRFEVIAF